MRSRTRSDSMLAAAYTGPALLYLALLFVWPLSVIAGYSVSPGAGETGLTLDNYRRAFDPLYLSVLLHSTAIAFATILAVVAGLTISASTSFAHDFWTNVLHGGRERREGEEVRVARVTAFFVGAISILIAIVLGPNANVAFLVALAFAALSHAAPAQKPNIILILADDLGWTDLGGYGSDLHETPVLDQLARDRMINRQALPPRFAARHMPHWDRGVRRQPIKHVVPPVRYRTGK